MLGSNVGNLEVGVHGRRLGVGVMLLCMGFHSSGSRV